MEQKPIGQAIDQLVSILNPLDEKERKIVLRATFDLLGINQTALREKIENPPKAKKDAKAAS